RSHGSIKLVRQSSSRYGSLFLWTVTSAQPARHRSKVIRPRRPDKMMDRGLIGELKFENIIGTGLEGDRASRESSRIGSPSHAKLARWYSGDPDIPQERFRKPGKRGKGGTLGQSCFSTGVRGKENHSCQCQFCDLGEEIIIERVRGIGSTMIVRIAKFGRI